MNLSVHLASKQFASADIDDDGREVNYEVAPGGVAIIRLEGAMTKHSSSLFGGVHRDGPPPSPGRGGRRRVRALLRQIDFTWRHRRRHR